MRSLANAAKKVVGFKQCLKAAESGQAQSVYLARDAEEKIRRPLLEICQERGIAVIEADTMAELGKASGIQVGTAAAAILRR